MAGASRDGDTEFSGSDLRVFGSRLQRNTLSNPDALINPTAGAITNTSPTSYRAKSAFKSADVNFVAMPGSLNESLDGANVLRRKGADSARKTGLVYARSTALDKAIVESGTVNVGSITRTRIAPVKAFGGEKGVIAGFVTKRAKDANAPKEVVKFMRKQIKPLSPVSQALEASVNIRTDRALEAAASKGLKGQKALDYVIERVPRAAEKVGLPTHQGLSADSFGRDKGLLQRVTPDGLLESTPKGKAAKLAGDIVKFVPIAGAAVDAKELWDEFNEEDVEFTEVAGATVDLLLGLTGIGGLAGDAIAFSFGADGLGSLLVGDED